MVSVSSCLNYAPSICLMLSILLSQETYAQSWKRYPLQLENNPILTFPDVEGAQYQYMSDSWFITARVTGRTTGKTYQLVTIFNRNSISSVKLLNFYQVSIFDYDGSDFTTYTDYDVAPIVPENTKFHAKRGRLDLGFDSGAGSAYWTTARSRDHELRPFVYQLQCPGIDHVTERPFSFKILADMQKKPVAFGASSLRGNFTFYAQQNTLTYFQTAPLVSGSVTFNGVTEEIQGEYGHIDRQIFPLYTGIFTPTGRQHSHEWRQINLLNGIDLAIWRQFDRVDGNRVIATTGTTTSYPPSTGHTQALRVTRPSWADGLPSDLDVEYMSYAKYPRQNYSTLIPPPSGNMYLPSQHIIRSKTLNMSLEATYAYPTPVAQLPIEYFEGPAEWRGTYNGEQVKGVGIFESTLGLYRDFELAQVLEDSVTHLPESSFKSRTDRDRIVALVKKLSTLVSHNPAEDNRVKAGMLATNKVIPALQGIKRPQHRSSMLEIANDFVDSLALVM